MVTSLIVHERIQTTVPKAKEVRLLADRIIRFGKEGTVAARQRANRIVREKPALTKLFEVLGPRYQDRDGGYTRVLKLAKQRKGDNAPMAIVEYVDRPGEIRAARPPVNRRSPETLSQVLADMGISPLTPAQIESLRKQYNP